MWSRWSFVRRQPQIAVGVGVLAAGALLCSLWAAQGLASHTPDGAIHVCATGSGVLRVVDDADDCRGRSAPLVLVTEEALATVGARVAALEAEVDALQTTVATQGAEIDALQRLLAGVTRGPGPAGNDTLRFSGMNLQLVNGTGATDNGNGLGNLILGYNAPRAPAFPGEGRTGSHYLVVGDLHEYTGFGGIIAGLRNSATGGWASITGGSDNRAMGHLSSVTGGDHNTAEGELAWVGGGRHNAASGRWSSVSGGAGNVAEGQAASAFGGSLGSALGQLTTVSGGRENQATQTGASAFGGEDNIAQAFRSAVFGGQGNLVVGEHAAVLGGRNNEANNT